MGVVKRVFLWKKLTSSPAPFRWSADFILNLSVSVSVVWINNSWFFITHHSHYHLCTHSHPELHHPYDSDNLSSPTHLSLSDGSEDQLDRLQQVELARATPMSQWRAGTVQAWLEVVMAMPMYIRTCSENVKSGKVGWNHWHETFVWVSLLCTVHFSPWHFAGFTGINRWRPWAGFRC